MDGITDQRIPYIIIYHRRSPAVVKGVMPYTDPAQGYDPAPIPQSILNIITMNKERDAKKYVFKNMFGHLMKYRYEDQKLTLRALEDFCRGTAFLSSRDPVGRDAFSLARQKPAIQQNPVDQRGACPFI